MLMVHTAQEVILPETAATVWLLPNGNVMHVCPTFTDLFGYGKYAWLATNHLSRLTCL
jgi:hypothetical protein